MGGRLRYGPAHRLPGDDMTDVVDRRWGQSLVRAPTAKDAVRPADRHRQPTPSPPLDRVPGGSAETAGRGRRGRARTQRRARDAPVPPDAHGGRRGRVRPVVAVRQRRRRRGQPPDRRSRRTPTIRAAAAPSSVPTRAALVGVPRPRPLRRARDPRSARAWPGRRRAACGPSAGTRPGRPRHAADPADATPSSPGWPVGVQDCARALACLADRLDGLERRLDAVRPRPAPTPAPTAPTACSQTARRPVARGLEAMAAGPRRDVGRPPPGPRPAPAQAGDPARLRRPPAEGHRLAGRPGHHPPGRGGRRHQSGGRRRAGAGLPGARLAWPSWCRPTTRPPPRAWSGCAPSSGRCSRCAATWSGTWPTTPGRRRPSRRRRSDRLDARRGPPGPAVPTVRPPRTDPRARTPATPPVAGPDAKKDRPGRLRPGRSRASSLSRRRRSRSRSCWAP